MRKYLRIINIDGTEGCGKTTQINLLSAYFTRLNIPHKVNCLEDNLESGIRTAEATKKYLEETDGAVVINDGSPARMVVTELVSGVPTNDILGKYKNLLFANEQLSHAYGTANLLLVLPDVAEANRRIQKRRELMGAKKYELNLELEKDIVKGMQFFDQHPTSKGLKFDVIKIGNQETMLEISESILKYLQDNFEIKNPAWAKMRIKQGTNN